MSWYPIKKPQESLLYIYLFVVEMQECFYKLLQKVNISCYHTAFLKAASLYPKFKYPEALFIFYPDSEKPPEKVAINRLT